MACFRPGAVLSRPVGILRALVLGEPLQPAWSALECAEEAVVCDRDVLCAIEASRRWLQPAERVLRRLSGRHRVLDVKRALAVAGYRTTQAAASCANSGGTTWGPLNSR